MSSSASSEPASAQDDEQRRRGRRIALVILACCAAPTVAAWLGYFVWQPRSRTNYGELVAPRTPDPELRLLDGAPFRLSKLRGKWLLLQIDPAACGEGCRTKLVYTRQVRLALGKDAERVERVLLLEDAANPDASLLREHQGLVVARAPRGALGDFAAPGDPTGWIFVIDPRGNLMLRFPGEPDGRKMLKDLSRLLRASRIG